MPTLPVDNKVLYSDEMPVLFTRPFLFLVLGTLLAASSLFAQGRRPPLPHEPLTVVNDGRIRTDLETVTVEGVSCLALSDIRGIFGGKEAWRRVSREVSYEIYGRRADFTLDSATAAVLGKDVAMESTVRFWTGHAYVPLSFLVSPEFQNLTGTTVRWDAPTRTLTVEPKPSVSSPELQSLGNKSRVIVEISPRINYRVMDNREGRLLVRLFGGRSQRAETLESYDGLIESVRLESQKQSCNLTVLLTTAAAAPQVRLAENPRRIVVDVPAKPGVYVASKPASPPDIIKAPLVTPLPVLRATPSGTSVAAGRPTPPVADSSVPVPAGKPASAASTSLAVLSPIRTIVIDAGHGGKDTGALGAKGTMEKDVNLRIARALAQALRREGRFNVILTRNSDEFIPLQERAEIANKSKADLFVSIHCNAALSKKSNGFEIYFLSENASDDIAAATARRENAVVELEGITGKAKEKIQELLWSMARTETMNESSEVAALIAQQVRQSVPIPSRGVRQANFYVLRGASMPAVLVESGFITHPQEESHLKSDRFQNKLVQAVYAGILDYEKRKIQARQSKSATGG